MENHCDHKHGGKGSAACTKNGFMDGEESQQQQQGQREPVLEWIYRAEGNRSLVIANLREKIVYRLSKRIKREGKNKVGYDAMREKLQKGIDFVHYVMSPLIGRHLARAGSLIELQNGFANHINLKVDQLRPGYRKTMEVDPECPFAVRLPDHCFVPCPSEESPSNPIHPTFGIEIKTKCGFLPDRANISPESDIKCSVCRFCLHQYIKIQKGKWSRRSDYCPVNLFSGNPVRMAKALRSLFKTPQNNLRMFKDGEPVFGDGIPGEGFEDCLKYFSENSNGQDSSSDRHLLNNLTDVLIKCLLHVPQSNTDDYHYPERICIRGQHRGSEEIEAGEGLPRACVLGRVLQTQRLDNLDIEQIYPLYERVRQHLDNHPEDRYNWNLDGPFHDESCWKLQNPSPYTEDDGSIEFAVRKVREFHVSRTAKDCSIMLAIQRCDQGQDDRGCNNVGEDTSHGFHTLTMPSGATYRFSLAVIDLDPKPWDKIPRYLKEDTEIVSYHKQFSSNIYGEYSRSPSSDQLICKPDGSLAIKVQNLEVQDDNGQTASPPLAAEAGHA